MRALATLLAIGLLVTPGCLDTGSSSEPAGTQELQSDEGAEPVLNRSVDWANLTEHKIVLENITDGWEALRLTTTPAVWGLPTPEDGWSKWLSLGVIVRGSPNSTIYLGDVTHDLEDDQTAVAFSAYEGGEGPYAFEKSLLDICHRRCENETPEKEDLVVLAGSPDGNVTIEAGLLYDLPRTQAEIRQSLRDRPRMNYGPNATGDEGFAGTFFRLTGDEETIGDYPAGQIEVESDRVAGIEGEIEVERERTIHGDHQMPERGTVGAAMTSIYATGTAAWNLSVDLPPWRIEDSGRAVAAEGSTITGQTPLAVAWTPTVAGPATIELQETHTGSTGPDTPMGYEGTLLTWGWVDTDLWEAFGWTHDHIAYPAPQEPGTDRPARPATSIPSSICLMVEHADRCGPTPAGHLGTSLGLPMGDGGH